MVIICKDSILTFAFDSCQIQDRWLNTIRSCLGEELRFDATLYKSPLSFEMTNDEVCVFIHKGSLCLTTFPASGQPPKYLTSWKLSGMRHFGISNGQYCIEVADKTVCGLFVLDAKYAIQMNILFKEMTSGQLGKNRSLSSDACCNQTETMPFCVSASSVLMSSASCSGNKSKSKDKIHEALKCGQTDSETSETENDPCFKTVATASIVRNEPTAWKVPTKSGAWLSNQSSAAGQNLHGFELKSNDVDQCQKLPTKPVQKIKSNLLMPEHSITYQQSTLGSSRYLENAGMKRPGDYLLLRSNRSLANKQLSNTKKSNHAHFASDSDRFHCRYSYSDAFSSCIKYFIGSLTSNKFSFSRSLSLLCCSSMVPESSCLHETHSALSIQHHIFMLKERVRLSALRGWQSEMLDRMEAMCGIKLASCQMRAQSLQSFHSAYCDLPLDVDISLQDGDYLQNPRYSKSVSFSGKNHKEVVSIETEKQKEQIIMLDCDSATHVTDTDDLGSKASKLTTCFDAPSGEQLYLHQMPDIDCIEWTNYQAVGGGNLLSSLPLTTTPSIRFGSGLAMGNVKDHYCVHGSLQRTVQTKDFLPISESNSQKIAISNSYEEMNLGISDHLKLHSGMLAASSTEDLCLRTLPSIAPVVSTRNSDNPVLCTSPMYLGDLSLDHQTVNHKSEGKALDGNITMNQGYSFGKSLSNSAIEVISNTCVSSYPILSGLSERRTFIINPEMFKNQSGILSTSAAVNEVRLNDSCCIDNSGVSLDHNFVLCGEAIDEQRCQQENLINCTGIQAGKQVVMQENVVNGHNVLSAYPNRSRLLSDSSLTASVKGRQHEEFSCLSVDRKSMKGLIPKRSFSLFSRFWRRSDSRNSQSSLPATFKIKESETSPCTTYSSDVVSEDCQISLERLLGNCVVRQSLPSECRQSKLNSAASPCLNLMCGYETGASSVQLACSKNCSLDIVKDDKTESDLIPRRKGEKSPVRNDPSPVRLIRCLKGDKEQNLLHKTTVTKTKLAAFSIHKFIQGKSCENRSQVNFSNSLCPKQSNNLNLNSDLTMFDTKAKCLKENISSHLLSTAILQPNDALIITNEREQRNLQESNPTKLSRSDGRVESSIKANCVGISESQASISCIRGNQTTNTNRPRSGKEYQHIYRRKLHENYSPHLISAPHASPVFAFEWENNSFADNHWSSEGDSLKYPSNTCSQITSERSRAYANLSLGRDGSLVISDDQPVCENDLPIVNYAEIDLSASPHDLSTHITKPAINYSPTIYAQIDIVATRAASQASLEHARQREDKMDRSTKRASFKLTGNRAIFRKSSIPIEKKELTDQ